MAESTVRYDENVLEELCCPVCLNYMHPPIMTCHAGHSFCGSCDKKLETCPCCRGTKTSGRNFCLEKLHDKLVMPCNNRSDGCTYVSLGDSMPLHEKFCLYKSEDLNGGLENSGLENANNLVDLINQDQVFQDFQDQNFHIDRNLYHETTDESSDDDFEVDLDRILNFGQYNSSILANNGGQDDALDINEEDMAQYQDVDSSMDGSCSSWSEEGQMVEADDENSAEHTPQYSELEPEDVWYVDDEDDSNMNEEYVENVLVDVQFDL